MGYKRGKYNGHDFMSHEIIVFYFCIMIKF